MRLLVIAWVLWCLLHSMLIIRPVTTFFRQRLGERFHRYRLFYNLFALLSLVPVLIYWKSLDSPLLFSWGGILEPLRLTLLVASGLLFLTGAQAYDMRHFLGLGGTESSATIGGNGSIIESGILGHTRHPWYLGTLLIVWSASRQVDTADLATNLILTAYLVIGTVLEERKLTADLGDLYQRYQQRVPMLIPLPLTGRWRMVRRLLFATLVTAFIALNLIAFLHVGAMTRFATGSSRTPPPENLDALQKVRTLLTGVTIPRPDGGGTPADLGLAFETHRFPGSGDHRLEAWFIPHGNEPRALVLLFHGYAAGKADLLATAQKLHGLGCEVLLVDFFGSGGSTGNSTTIGYREAEDAAAAFHFAGSHWPGRPIILYGLSMGGAAALRAVSEEHATPSALVMESTFDSMLNTVRRRFRAMKLPPSPLAELLVFWGGVRGGFNAFAFNPADYAARVNCPALVLCGSNDLRVSPDESKRLYDALAGSKRYSEFPGAGHQPLSSADHQRWQDDMAWLLAAVEQAEE